jgi:hypothetical protein
MSDGDMQRKPKMGDSSRFLREKHLQTPVRVKIVHQGHGRSEDGFESPTLRRSTTFPETKVFLLNETKPRSVKETAGVRWTQSVIVSTLQICKPTWPPLQ